MTEAEREALAFAVLAQHNGTSGLLLRHAMGMSRDELLEVRGKFEAAQRRAAEIERALENHQLMPHLDRCLSRKFSPPTLPATGRELEQARDETFCAVAGHNHRGNPNTAT